MFSTNKSPIQTTPPIEDLHKISKVENRVDQNIETADLSDNQRYITTHSSSPERKSDSSVVMGSTFCSGRGTDKSEKDHMVLDAIRLSYTRNKLGIVDGLIIAVADGAGGHSKREHDEEISKAATTAVNCAVDILGSDKGKSVKTLESNIENGSIIEEIANDIRSSVNSDVYQNTGCLTTLASARMFLQENGSYRFVGFNVGDCSIHAWNPKTKSFKTLLSARNPLSATGTSQTSTLPDTYERSELDFISCELDPETILIPVTDGVTDILPGTVETVTVQNKEYEIKRLETAPIVECLQAIPDNSPVEAYIKAFSNHVFQTAEKERQKELSNIPDNEKTAYENYNSSNETLSKMDDDSQEEMKASEDYIRDRSLASIYVKHKFGDDITIGGAWLPDPKCEIVLSFIKSIKENPFSCNTKIKSQIHKQIKMDELDKIISTLESRGYLNNVSHYSNAVQVKNLLNEPEKDFSQKHPVASVILGGLLVAAAIPAFAAGLLFSGISLFGITAPFSAPLALGCFALGGMSFMGGLLLIAEGCQALRHNNAPQKNTTKEGTQSSPTTFLVTSSNNQPPVNTVVVTPT